MILHAKPVTVTGKTLYATAMIRNREFVKVQPIPPPEELFIEETESGYFLYHCWDGVSTADDWFPSLEEAYEQADWAYEVKPEHWKPVDKLPW